MKKTKVKTYFDKLMANEKFRRKFDREYQDFLDNEEGYKRLKKLSVKEKGKEKRVTKNLLIA